MSLLLVEFDKLSIDEVIEILKCNNDDSIKVVAHYYKKYKPNFLQLLAFSIIQTHAPNLNFYNLINRIKTLETLNLETSRLSEYVQNITFAYIHNKNIDFAFNNNIPIEAREILTSVMNVNQNVNIEFFIDNNFYNILKHKYNEILNIKNDIINNINVLCFLCDLQKVDAIRQVLYKQIVDYNILSLFYTHFETITKRSKQDKKEFKMLYNMSYYDEKFYDLCIEFINCSINTVVKNTFDIYISSKLNTSQEKILYTINSYKEMLSF
ncbi:MAG: hypothetical protein N2505_00540 [Endomicrobia bacterium]|nr:hypothetical protein [Endomicrobiia bacterium]